MKNLAGPAVRALPLLLTLFAQVVFAGISLELKGPMPLMVLVSICYWSFYRPDSMDVVSVFVIGIVCDVLAGFPPGTAPLTLLLLKVLIPKTNRRYALRFWPYEWIMIPMFIAGGITVMHATGAVVQGASLSVVDLLFTIGVTVAIYPLGHYGFNHVLHLLQNLPRSVS